MPKCLRRALLAAVIGFTGAAPAAADFASALADFNSGNYAAAFAAFRRLAEAGDVEAQFNVGRFYQNGWGVEQNYAEAMAWYRASAEQGNAVAQNAVGYMLVQGLGMPHDPVEAVRWFQLAAAQGNAESQNHLGYAYLQGDGIGQDYAEALKWLFRSAYGGDAFGQYNLAFLYESGKTDTFLQPDLPKAKYWYAAAEAAMQPLGDAAPSTIREWMNTATARLAGTAAATELEIALAAKERGEYAFAAARLLPLAVDGDPEAQVAYGDLCYFGSGMNKNLSEAADWYRQAAKQGHARGQVYLGYAYQNGEGVAQDPAEALVSAGRRGRLRHQPSLSRPSL